MSTLQAHAPPLDRDRANTWPAVNTRLDAATEDRLRQAAQRGPNAVAAALEALDAEWDLDRTIETEAPLMGLAGLLLGIAVDRRLLVIPAVVSTMLAVRATHGWYPLLPVFRRLAVRSGDEIERERYALKALRGDLDAPPVDGEAALRAAAAWKAVWS